MAFPFPQSFPQIYCELGQTSTDACKRDLLNMPILVGFLAGIENSRERWQTQSRRTPHPPAALGSIPDTWVTFYTEDMGNTLAPNGFCRGSSLQVSSSK